MRKTKSSQYYVSSPINSIIDILKVALQSLVDEVQGSHFTLNDFRLIHPYVTDDNPRIFIDFSLKDKYEKYLISKKLISDSSVAIFENFISVPLSSEPTCKLGGIKIAIEEANQQPINVVHLIEHSIKVIESIENITVLDYIYVPFCNEEGTEQPYIHIYYSKLVLTPLTATPA